MESRYSVEAIKKLVAEGESEHLEFKKSTAQLDRAGETICGFLNANGGILLFGVTDNLRIVGQTVSDKTMQQIAETMRNINPSPELYINYARVGKEKDVIIIETCSNDEKPYLFKNRPFIRVQNTTSLMPRDIYGELLIESNHAKKRWENRIAEELSVNDLDKNEILKTARIGIERGRLPESTGVEPKDIMKRLNLLKDDVLTNAAAVLYMNCQLNGYPQCVLRLARFIGNDKKEFADNKVIYGNAFYLLDEAMAFFHKHLYLSGKITDTSVVREEKLSVPVIALRESVVNALCHRDYRSAEGFVSIAIFDNRIEVINSGTYPFGIKPEDLLEDHPSKPRNPDISSVFYRRGLVENWGRGTQSIVELCLSAGLPVPVFSEENRCAKTTIFVLKETEKTREETEKTREETEKTREETEKTREETEKTREEILLLIRENPEITMAQMAQKVGITQKGVEWHVAKLRREKVLKREGSTKKGRWLIIS